MTRLDAAQISNLPTPGGGGGLPMAIVREVRPKGVYAANFPGGAWYARNVNQLVTNSNWGVSLADKTISLPAGTYWVQWWCTALYARFVNTNLYSPSLDKWLDRNQYFDFTDASHSNIDLWFQSSTLLSIAAPATIELRQNYAYSFSGYHDNATGTPRNLADEECYSWIALLKLS